MKRIIIEVISYATLILAVYLMWERIQQLNYDLDKAVVNVKAYSSERQDWDRKKIVFELKINQLEYYADSLNLAMKKVANDNGIKDKYIKALQYQLEKFSKQDTIFIRDTIFRDPEFILDTCITDEWNKSCLHLAYPGTIALNNEYKNDKYITLSSHKEPIKPRKWFLSRWFTRKHTVIEVLVIDKNPYVETPQQRYIEIVNN